MENPVNEDQLQAKCFKWFDETFPAERKMLFAVPNGDERDKRTANKLKAMGVQPGVSDLVFVTDEVTFIEMKFGNGVQSDGQKVFEAKVLERGHSYRLCYTFEEFKTLILKLLARYERSRI